MVDISSLPKVPDEALTILIARLISVLPESEMGIVNYLGNGTENSNALRTLIKLASIASARISDNEIKSLTAEALQYDGKHSLNSVRLKLEGVQSLIFAMQFDQHFINTQDVKDFDSTQLDEGDKTDIRVQLAKARKLAEDAKYLSDDHKRRVIHRISQVENELFKEIVGFKAFIVAGYEASGLLKQFGKDAEPLADAIQKTRTITERKVEGYQRIEADEKPKQITGPDE